MYYELIAVICIICECHREILSFEHHHFLLLESQHLTTHSMALSLEWEWILLIISNSIHVLFIVGVVYTSYRFYQYQDTQALQKRYPFLVRLMSFCIILYLIHHLVYKFAFIYGGHPSQFRHNPSVGNTLSALSIIFYFLSLHGIAIILIARSWLIYFNTKYAIQMQV